MRNLKFQCLNYLTVVEAKASDHHPIIMENLCTFNMLCRCKVYKKYANNAFGIEETKQDYQDRLLHKLLPIISELILEHKITLFAFQEAPPLTLSKDYTKQEQETFEVAKEFYSTITTKFNYKIEPEYYLPMWRGSEACGLLFVYHQDHVFDKNITQEIKPMISRKNRKRFQAIQFYLKHSDIMALKLVNMHAHFDNQLGTTEDVKMLIDKQFIIAADFNLISWPEMKNAIQIITKTDPGLMPTDTYDGIVKNMSQV